jgi:hypothetical protein
MTMTNKDGWKGLALIGLTVSACVRTGDMPPQVQAAEQTFRYPPYILDLQQNYERYVPLYYNQIINCSGKEFICLKAGSSFGTAVMSIVLPRQCTKPKVGDTWSHANQSTRVLGRRPAATRTGNGARTAGGESYLLGTAGYQNVVFEYQPALGLTVIYKAEVGENIVDEAARDPIRFPGSFDGWVFEHDATSAAFGACIRR